ncbi:MAG: hypothetical protein ACWA41_12595 [Putridiphycobacter sp.]
MKLLITILGLTTYLGLFGQQTMITYDSMHVQTDSVVLRNPIKMTAHYDPETTEVVLTSYQKAGFISKDKYLVKGITTTDSFKIYHLRDEDVIFEIVIGEGYFIMEYGDHYDVFPQNK